MLNSYEIQSFWYNYKFNLIGDVLEYFPISHEFLQFIIDYIGETARF